MNFYLPLFRFFGMALCTWPLLIQSATPDGAELYRQHCAICHGMEGQGIPGVFPPLAKSDFLVESRDKALRAPLEGLFGKITVNGVAYEGGMPPVLLKDEQIASVFGHIYASWDNNKGKAPTEAEIKKLRAKTKFPTHEALVASMVSSQLPPAPEGWELKVGAEFSFSPVRMAAHPDGVHVLFLTQNGDVWSWKTGTQEQELLFPKETFFDMDLGDILSLGMTVDREGRLYVTSNQCNKKTKPVTNEITVFRTRSWSKETPWTRPEPWLRTVYPFGIGPYNHGLSHIAQGPDGFMYINSGARTDGGEAGKQPNYATTGENERTATMWRVDPKDEKPEIQIYARGLRNSFGFCWDDEKRMIATENGPDADAPEELNVIVQGRHYGFPYQFADWTKKPYPHTPDVPAGLQITQPLRNVGPDAGGSADKSISTFDPHSCPSGIVWLGKDWPAPLGGSFLTARFGNLIKGTDRGYDVLQMHPDFTAGTTTVKRLLAPLGRPIDILTLPGHRVLIAEYCRGTNLAAGIGTPGRVLVLEPKKVVDTPK
ncbi:MAG: PQQ-dependent sugar dehydrogenase [Verrucomicrobium sp.]